jgi:formylglycine-generating enzyme required for sulfatase activity
MGDTCQRQTDKVRAMAEIFISYANEDKDRLKPIVKVLENLGRTVWWDRKILPGEIFSVRIEKEIRAAKCVMVFWSKKSVTSNFVQTEAADGAERKILVPARIDNVKIPFEFKRIQAADLTDWKGKSSHSGFQQILTAISVLLGPPKPPKAKIHPKLDAMVEIPAGKFTYKDIDDAKIEKNYMIDVYPVTNSWFRKFIEAGGYKNFEYWSNEGQKWLQESKTTSPNYWDNKKWNQPEHPVVGVSFYEAEAYAKWSGKQLPIEEEWERAARGTDGRKFPWGDDFDPLRCNTSESNNGGTTPVTRYPNGVSLEGCYDLVGNVWEWCQDWTDNSKKNFNVVRGGSWVIGRNYNYAERSFREGYRPDSRLVDVGFRCVRIL